MVPVGTEPSPGQKFARHHAAPNLLAPRDGITLFHAFPAEEREMSARILEELVLAPNVAASLGVKTSTLAKWRSLGTDPDGAVWLSPTTVAYPRESVRRWLEERRAHPKKRGRPPKRLEGNGPKAA